MGARKKHLVTANGSWEDIAETIRVTKYALIRTWKLGPFYDHEHVKNISQDRIPHTRFLMPEGAEAFEDFRSRLMGWNLGNSTAGILAGYIFETILNIRHSSRAVSSVYAEMGDRNHMLAVRYAAEVGKIDLTIRATGAYQQRGASIAAEVKTFLKRNNVMHHYNTIDSRF